MLKRFTAVALVLTLSVMPLAGCATLMSKICEHSPAVLENLEMAQQKLEIIRAFLAVATTSDLQVELEIKGVSMIITRDDIDNTLALIDQILGTIKGLIADACAGNAQQAIKAASAVEANPAVMAAMAMAKRAGALPN